MNFFNKIKLQTPENVELEFILAGIGNRVLACSIDYLLLLIVQVIFILIFSIGGLAFVDFLVSLKLPGKIELWLYAILSLILFFTYIGYFMAFEAIWRGQTPGKRVAKIRVIRDDGRPLRLQQATLRSLLRPIDDLLYFGLFLVIFTKLEKRVGDWVAGTIVIQEVTTVNKANFKLSGTAEALAIELLAIADVSRLLPEDFAVIREYLRRRESLFPQARIALGKKLAFQVKEIITLEDVPSGITPNLFLEAVYLAYQKQSSEF